MSILIEGATIIDGVSDRPIEGQALLLDGDRIARIAPPEAFGDGDPAIERIDARGKYVTAGLMNANVHLMGGALSPGNLMRYLDRIEDLIVEAAQVALKNGLTTVFDTLGMRLPLIAVRDRIDACEVEGSRILLAGWIVGLDGLLSLDFSARAAEVLSAVTVERINGACAENVGPALSWMDADQVRGELRRYIASGIDFVKYASSEHRWGDPTTSLVFSPDVQRAIVEESHAAGLTAQAHASSLESLRIAVEAGCDLIQHCNITGPFPIQPHVIETMVKRGTGAVLFPFTKKRFDWVMANCEIDRAYFKASDLNCRNLLEAGATLLLANDGMLSGAELASDPRRSKFWVAPGEDDLSALDTGHFAWLKAMEEKGMAPMELLRAATRNIAEAYGVGDRLGTIEAGKIADLVLYDADPLASSENYRRIHMVIKDGRQVDRGALPRHPILDRPLEEPAQTTLAYRSHRHVGRSGFPMCPCCVEH